MPKATCEAYQIHYESYGEGEEALIILNGIMMSTASWKPFIPKLSQSLRVVLMDFLDQGQSDEANADYTQSIQVKAVCAVMDALELKSCSVLGISYGGEVAIQLAAAEPKRISKLILANTTAYTHAQLKAIGDQWIQAAQTYDGHVFFKATIPPVYSWQFYEREIQWLNAREATFVSALSTNWYDGFVRLVRSAESYDARDLLKKIKCPVLVMGSEEDIITPIALQRAIANEIPHSNLCILPNCGHASMYEQPELFFSLVVGFLLLGDSNFKIV